MKLKRLTRLALLTAIALTIFLVELQIPAPVPVPGVKLGLSNIVTLYCVFAYGPWSALAVLLCRVLLGALCSGRVMALAYSLAGGLLSWALSCGLRRIVSEKQKHLNTMKQRMGQSRKALYRICIPMIMTRKRPYSGKPGWIP